MSGVVFIFVILTMAFALNFGQKKNQLKAQTDLLALKEKEVASERATTTQEKEKSMQLKADAEALKANAVEAMKDNSLKGEQIDLLSKMLKKRDDARNDLLDKLTVSLRRKGVKLEVDKDNGVIRLPEELLFQSGEAVLQQDGIDALGKIADELLLNLRPLCLDGAKYRLEAFFVEGHSDNAQISPGAKFKDNWELSTARAVNTAGGLTKQSPQLNQLLNPSKQPILGVSGYGAQRPVVPNEGVDGQPDKDAMRKNRRIDLRFLMAYPKEEMERVKAVLNESKLK